MQSTTQQELALCGAFPGGCGFRGRDWRKGQRVASYSIFDGKPFCKCGSEMRPFEPRRFVGKQSPRDALASMSYAQWLEQHRAQPGGWLTTAAPTSVLRDCYEQRLRVFDAAQTAQDDA